MPLQVVRSDRRTGLGQASRDAVGHTALVEIGETGLREALERSADGRPADDLAGPPGPTVRAELGAPGSTAVLKLGGEDPGRPFDRGREALVHWKAITGQVDGGPEDLARRQAPIRLVRVGPRPDGSGHRDGQGTPQWQPLEAGPAQGRRVGARRRPTGPVEGRLPFGPLVPDEPERVSAQPACLGHYDGEDRVRRNRRVHRRAPDPQYGQSRRCREVVRSDDSASAPA